jgi:hypothetical protein
MLNASRTKAKRCCSREHEQLVRRIGSCEIESNNTGQRHNCYRREAKNSGARAKACMVEYIQ